MQPDRRGALAVYSVTRDSVRRTLYLKVVNASSQRQYLDIQLLGKESTEFNSCRDNVERSFYRGNQLTCRSHKNRPAQRHDCGCFFRLAPYISGILD